MKIANYICLCSLLATASVMNAGSDGESFRTDINPALLYYQAYMLAPEPMSSADDEYLHSAEGRTRKLPERFDALYAGYDNQFKLVRQAAHSTVPCDWGIDMTPGTATLLPQLARAKGVVLATRFRVMWALQNDREEDAVANPPANLAPTIANYRRVANQSMEELDELLTRQANQVPAPAPVYTASILTLADGLE